MFIDLVDRPFTIDKQAKYAQALRIAKGLEQARGIVSVLTHRVQVGI